MIASPRELTACIEAREQDAGIACTAPASARGARALVLTGASLEIEDVVAVARYERPVAITEDPEVRAEMAASRSLARRAAMPHAPALPEPAAGAGATIPAADVRAAMLVLANSLMRGASGVRLELVQRLCAFLNAGFTPVVHELGSIGASGDRAPLARIAGAITGHDAAFVVDTGATRLPSSTALMLLGLAPLTLEPHESVALIDGTAGSAAMAAGCVHDARRLLSLAIGAQMLAAQAVDGCTDALDPFIHAHKPHRGQRWVARQAYALLHGSRLTQRDATGSAAGWNQAAVHSLPQRLGPVVDAIAAVARDVEVEINSTTGPLLLDATRGRFLFGGNALGEYVAVGMDRLRAAVSLVVGRLDAQLAQLASPALPALRLTAGAIAPLVAFHGQPIADRTAPTAESPVDDTGGHAWSSALLAARQLRLAEQHVAVTLLGAVQALELRVQDEAGTDSVRSRLSPGTQPLYDAVREVARRRTDDGPLPWAEQGRGLDQALVALAADIQRDGLLAGAVEPVIASLGVLGDRG